MNAVAVSPSLEWRAGADLRSDLARLCRSCGLCCDGSLFGLVPLQPDEVDAARRHRLPVVGSGKGFAQRCTALETADMAGERGCAIYRERPRSCRQFTCRLYERHRAQAGPLKPRLAAVKRVRELVATLEATGLTPDDFDAGGGEGPAVAAFAELTERLRDDFARGA